MGGAMATNRGTVDRRGARRDLWVVGGAVLLAVLVTFGLSVVRDSTPGVVSSEGGSTSTCTAPPGAGAAFSDFIPTEDDADFELVEVRLIGANNLELVEARAVAVPEERQERTPSAPRTGRSAATVSGGGTRQVASRAPSPVGSG